MSAAKAFEVGQYWRTRNGACLRVESLRPDGGCWAAYGAGIKVLLDAQGFEFGAIVTSGFDVVSQITPEECDRD